METDKSVASVKGIGVQLEAKLKTLGIHTIGDLINYYPRRYDDYSNLLFLNSLKPGVVSVKARITSLSGRYVRRGMHVTEALASDATATVRLVWFNQPYRLNSVLKGKEYYIAGEYGLHGRRMSITSPTIELANELPLNTARIVPIYKTTKGINSVQIRKMINEALLSFELTETLPEWLLQTNSLMSYETALKAVHFPDSCQALDEARRRLGYEEILCLTLASLMNKQLQLKESSTIVPFDEKLARKFVANLKFNLTNSQRKIVWQIYKDMESGKPMNRLVEGDVGSGKTVVAAMAALMVISQGLQAALMAPTELLARQHADTIHELLKPLGLNSGVGLITSSLKPQAKAEALSKLASGEMKMAIGTHALISSKSHWHNLGLAIVDEQHRFGVDQRKKLQVKAGRMPHVLQMTATPIPRSLALTVYGELDISILDEAPLGRKPIITKIVSPNSLTQLYDKIESELELGRQCFWVCPQIYESADPEYYSGSEINGDQSKAGRFQSAEKVYEHVTKVFKERRVGLLHGKLGPSEKESTMKGFLKGDLDILVSTTVIEVGVDVPNATVMIIESPERFGLAQIHQLRGRVGRAGHQGYCYIVLSDSQPPSKRLRILEQSNNGFELAEYDMEIRGPGAIYGSLQHGALDLRVAQLSDTKLIASAREGAQLFLDKKESLLKYKYLAARVNAAQAVTNLN